MADIAASRATNAELVPAVQAALGELPGRSESAIVDAVAALPLAGIITTSWDDLLLDSSARAIRGSARSARTSSR